MWTASSAASTASRRAPATARAQLLASGVGVPWALEAQQLLKDDWGIVADVWSVTSWTELRRDGLAADEHNFLNPLAEPRTAYVTHKLQDTAGPVIAVSDYMHAVQDQIRPSIRVATRPWAPTASASPTPAPPRAASSRSTARRSSCAPQALAEEGLVDRALSAQAIERYRLHDVTAGTTGNAGGES